MLDKKCKLCLREGMQYHESTSASSSVTMGHCRHCGALVRLQTKPLPSKETWLSLKDEVLILDEDESNGYWAKHDAMKKVIDYLRTDESCAVCKTGHLEPHANLAIENPPVPMHLYRKCSSPDCHATPIPFTEDEGMIRQVIDCLRSMHNPVAASLSVLYEARLLGYNVHDTDGNYLDFDFLAQQIMEHSNDN